MSYNESCDIPEMKDTFLPEISDILNNDLNCVAARGSGCADRGDQRSVRIRNAPDRYGEWSSVSFSAPEPNCSSKPVNSVNGGKWIDPRMYS